MNKIDTSIKKEIGQRFKRFREAICKTQTQLAKELNVYQSTITNIEVGKTFPSIKYLHRFFHTYRLNTNWLLGNKGDIFITIEEQEARVVSLLPCHVPKAEPKYEKYNELIKMMKVPAIEQIILAKLVELKVLAKEEIKEFFDKEEIKLKKA
jgi:DNA-binding XRE family transcriptional regulator